MVTLNKKFIFTALFAISILVNIFLALLLVNNVYATKTQQVNVKVLSFTSLFVEKVLMSSQDVDLDTRVMLEATVRNLNDQEILDQWQKFTATSDNHTAGTEAKKLLSLLVKKISY